MTHINRNALASLPLTPEAVAKIYASYPDNLTTMNLHGYATIRRLCESHERLRMELEGATALLAGTNAQTQLTDPKPDFGDPPTFMGKPVMFMDDLDTPLTNPFHPDAKWGPPRNYTAEYRPEHPWPIDPQCPPGTPTVGKSDTPPIAPGSPVTSDLPPQHELPGESC